MKEIVCVKNKLEYDKFLKEHTMIGDGYSCFAHFKYFSAERGLYNFEFEDKSELLLMYSRFPHFNFKLNNCYIIKINTGHVYDVLYCTTTKEPYVNLTMLADML